MPLETGTTIAELNPAWPLGSDPKAQGDDHLRLIKSILQSDAVALSDTGSADIVGADLTEGWQTVGDVLICWAYIAVDASGNATWTFPQEFGAAPVVLCSMINEQNGIAYSTHTGGITTTSAQLQILLSATNAPAGSANGLMCAIGEAPDSGVAGKKPKTVQTIGGAEIQEFHDASVGGASWRIIGSTLECWGTGVSDGGTGVVTVVFPKSFGSNVSVQATASIGGLSVATTSQNLTATGVFLVPWRTDTDAAAPNVAVSWRAVGEWDGVS